MKTFKDYLNEAKTKFKVGDRVKEVEPMGQFKPGETLEIVQIKNGRIGVVALGQNPKEVLFDDPKNFKLVEFKVGDKVKEVNPMGQFKPGETLEIVQIRSGRIGVIAKGQNPKDALFDNPSNFKFVNEAESLDEAVVHNSNNKLRLKAGSSEILITTKGNNVEIFVQEGRERVMFEGKSDDLKAIKDFFSKL